MIDMENFAICIENNGKTLWVSSPTNTLTDNPELAAVIPAQLIDELYSIWDDRTQGKADIVTYNELMEIIKARRNKENKQ